MRLALFGATGKTGRYLLARLLDDGHEVTAIGRNRARLDALDARAAVAIADLDRPASVAPTLEGADCVISLAHARFTEALLGALPDCCERVILTGSTRKFTRLRDPAAEAVREAERQFSESGRAGVMLHPSMIYGAPDDRNVNRILRLLRRWPDWLPALAALPDGGRHSLQPVFVDDVVAAFAAAVSEATAIGPPIILAGPVPISYADFVRACGRAVGRSVFILPLPVGLLASLARLAASVRLPMPFGEAEIRRAIEDKRFDVSDMRVRLGVAPRPLEEGLSLKIDRGWY